MLGVGAAALYSHIQIDFKHVKWFLNCTEQHYMYILGIYISCCDSPRDAFLE